MGKLKKIKTTVSCVLLLQIEVGVNKMPNKGSFQRAKYTSYVSGVLFSWYHWLTDLVVGKMVGYSAIKMTEYCHPYFIVILNWSMRVASAKNYYSIVPRSWVFCPWIARNMVGAVALFSCDFWDIIYPWNEKGGFCLYGL